MPMAKAETLGVRDPKSLLQEQIQAEGKTTPHYRVLSTSGPAHEQRFLVECVVDGIVIGHGEGRSKRLAERAAALAALAARADRTDT